MANPWDNDPVVGGKTSSPAEFAQVYGGAAKTAGDALGVDPSVVLGQWGLETGWGKSIIPGTNNLGNIKDFSGSGVGATDNMTGSRDKYRAYATPEDFARDYASLIERKYPGARNAGKDPAKFTAGLKGYAEDPRYPEKIAQASRMASGEQSPLVRGLNAVAGAILPSAQAAPAATAKGNPWDNDPIVEVSQPGAAPAQPAPGKAGGAMQGIGNIAAGLVRGAGSIGATVLYPIDKATDLIKGDRKEKDFDRLILGDAYKAPLSRNEERRANMDAGLQELGAQPDSLLYQGGKIGAEIAGTLGTGGVIAKGAQAVGAAPAIVNAIRTAGMSTGQAGGGNLLARMLGGGITGGAAAGIVNPEQAVTGAAIGGALPVVGNALGAIVRTMRGPKQSADLASAIQSARGAGYVIPPSQARPTLANRALEGFSGKITTAQNASAQNAGVTNKLVAQDLGLAADTKITPDVLKGLRDTAGQSYRAIGSTGTITPAASYKTALDAIEAPFQQAQQAFPNAKASPVIDLVESLRSPSFDAASAVEKIKQLRTAADDAFRSGNTDVARASRSAAGALEDAIESHLQTVGQAPLLQQFRDARKLIAKTYSVEKALNPTTGAIDARALASQLKRGKPLSGGTKDAAEFAGRFPKAAQPIEGMGSLPQTSPLDWALGGSLSAMTSNPLALASVLARPAARSLVLSPLVQNRLVQSTTPNRLASLLTPEVRQFGYRAAPVAGSR